MEESADLKDCSECGESIKKVATTCKHCGSKLGKSKSDIYAEDIVKHVAPHFTSEVTYAIGNNILLLQMTEWPDHLKPWYRPRFHFGKALLALGFGLALMVIGNMAMYYLTLVGDTVFSFACLYIVAGFADLIFSSSSRIWELSISLEEDLKWQADDEQIWAPILAALQDYKSAQKKNTAA